ncbi:regulator of telomere elongation helicase 1 homolog [Lactuca sativa]|uniref:regulator of telomere elongation helicase 1 homolog n=1 Tax=Lactuca sativa TaxID=4236 RepID=UPI000CC2C527|nr:regulator of telomere elongation helicase 1 homolog [Lactuca sativa]
MPTYKIRGINVEFPFEAYDCQLVYMEKVIQSLQDRSNALLESPTGTGKTLCLLCATLAWRKSLGSFSTGRNAIRSQDTGGKNSEGPSSQSESSRLPTIIYTSRTHSQIRQVVQELKRTIYRPKMVVLGSREQLCIHPDVSLLHGKTQTNACHFLCQKRTKRYCTHFPRVSEFVKNNPGLGDEPIDIEDLVNIGKQSGPCPYYMSRELHKVVDILFAPYNYLIDPGNRKSLSIEWANSILIFDEAHNLEGICADAASFDLPSSLLTSCISEAQNCVDLAVSRRDQSNDTSYNPDNFAILRALLLKLEKRISEVQIDSKELGFTKPGPYIYELFGELNITHKTATKLIDTIEDATVLLEEDAKTSDPQKTKGTVNRLESISDILKIIFKSDGNDAHAKYYRVHVQEVEVKSSDTFKGKASRIFSWWCFNPGVAMEEFAKRDVGSIILTSGTLSPMDSFAEELKLNFPIRLENPHVIQDNQLWAGIVPVGPSGHPFNSSYRTRDSPEYKLNLGNSIVNFARIVPDGLLVFFPSYYLLNLCIDFWKNTGVTSTNSSTIWERICKHKLPVVEPRQSSLFPQAIDDYMAKLRDNSTTGAVFFAVCRGKVSEGLDFADQAGRAVIVTGIPFAMRNDPKIRLKREFLDQQALSQKGSKVLTGEEWYSQQASRAVNQAVGRVIRHRHDHGAIIFCDERFSKQNHQSQISLWIRPHLKCYSKFGDVVFTLTRFFRDAAISCPVKQKSTQIQEPGEKSSRDKIISLDKLDQDKFLKSLIATSNKSQSIEPSSSSLPCSSELRRVNISSRLSQILPANRSNLSFNAQNQTSSLNNNNNNNSNVEVKKHEVIDLVDEETSSQLSAPYFIKKRKIENPKNENLLQKCDNGIREVKKEIAVEERRTELINLETVRGSSSSNSTSLACENQEKKGSTFLIQVREKLSDGEYKEFVGFMKALKSKAMKIGHVLQCIMGLFSAPDRLHLLQRFKDYIPAKYHTLYEEYLEKTKTNDAVTVDLL